MFYTGVVGRKGHAWLRLEERVGKGDLVAVLQERVLHVVGVNVEENRHVHLEIKPFRQKASGLYYKKVPSTRVVPDIRKPDNIRPDNA